METALSDARALRRGAMHCTVIYYWTGGSLQVKLESVAAVLVALGDDTAAAPSKSSNPRQAVQAKADLKRRGLCTSDAVPRRGRRCCSPALGPTLPSPD